MTLDQLLAALKDILNDTDAQGSTPVRLIVNGTSYPVDDIWFMPHAGVAGELCIGDDPR